ncbi:MAG: NADH-quinone oxidoreductase subunit C [Propionibacterium sp.]|nr:NADH-quinone oxidoreductase subunit C [Propionibacterium sp.]
MADFRADIEAAHAEGFTFLIHLTAIDELGRSDDFRLLALLERTADGARRDVSTLVGRDDAVAPRIDDLYPAASWLQRQIHDLFGITFDGADGRPLIHHGDGWPLRKEFLLEPRAETPWPGALEPGESSPGGRKLLPVGVPDPAVVADQESTDADIALSATGTRVRGRRR